jgi:hypothetical protein
MDVLCDKLLLCNGLTHVTADFEALPFDTVESICTVILPMIGDGVEALFQIAPKAVDSLTVWANHCNYHSPTFMQ